MPRERTLTPERADVVTHTIKIDGRPTPREFQVISISVSREVNRISRARLVIADGDSSAESFAISNQDLFVPGSKIEILLGYRSTEETVFRGVIVKHSIRITEAGRSTLRLQCYDEAVKMTLEPRCRYFVGQKDSDVAEELVQGHGLSAKIQATSVTHQELVQFYATDWDFMLSRLDANGWICLSDGDTVTAGPPALDPKNVAATLIYGATMLEFDAEIDARTQLTRVTAVSWDPASQEIIEQEASDPGVPETGNLSAEEIAATLGAEHRYRHSGKLPRDELQAWADSRLKRHRMAKIRGRVSFHGVTSVAPGQLIELQGVGERFSGIVFVSAVHHRVSEGSWVTDVQFGLSPQAFAERMSVHAPPASSLLPAVRGLQVGLVTKLEGDPEGESRIQVRLPIVDARAEGVWARMAALDAGDHRGSFYLPEIGDEVVVGFINLDPRDPVVLGMLHSSAKPPPFEAYDDNPAKGYVSRAGMKLVFDEEERSITIATPGGSRLLLSDDELSLTLEDQNGNRIVLDSDGITIWAEGDLKIEALRDVKIVGRHVSLEGSASFAASGEGSSELTSSGSVTVKGSTVMIN